MNTKVLDLACAAVLGTILTLGLWPFHAPSNGVAWLGSRNGLRFTGHGTVISTGVFGTSAAPRADFAGSLEIWLQPRIIWDRGTLLAFSAPEDLFRFSLRYSEADLRVEATLPDGRGRPRIASLSVEDVFRRATPAFITVTAGARGTAVYVDGVPIRAAPWFRLGPDQWTGRLILGDAPGQTDTFEGRLLGVAVYGRELTPHEARQNYEAWTREGRPPAREEAGRLALYLFDERAGSMVHDRGGRGIDLSIPKKYSVFHQIFLEPVWSEFNYSRSYWSAALKNIVGFLPFGFCFCARLSMSRRSSRAVLITVVLGALASVTIEVLQSQLPTRDSGTTDIITNTLGTWLGAALFHKSPARALLGLVVRPKSARVAYADHRR